MKILPQLTTLGQFRMPLRRWLKRSCTIPNCQKANNAFPVHLDYSRVIPTLNAMTLPQPTHLQELKGIVLASYRRAWPFPTLLKNRCLGQKQAGINIYGPDIIGESTGIQCKRHDTFSLGVVKAEIGNAGKLKGHLSTLRIVTTADHDAKLH
ncbi:hypothetical protein [Sphingomonas sp. HMP6]|uniref:hypothetical protein n=1 Tax=Sphingomonas sp. HMP6 TaxID=1517551 RepID=UPI001596409D|nr:hypothetical protein [Sphingomonas sp. HMP6]BCA58160.1 hypothetical protein HMP06_0929 [Sphingomonas sp. HMP6]